MKKLTTILILILIMGCVKEPDFDQVIEEPVVLSEFANFDFTNVTSTQINLTFKDAQSTPLKGIKIQLLDLLTNQVLVTGFTNKSGVLSQKVALANHLTELVMEAQYIGIPNSVSIPIISNSVTLNYNGSIDPSQVINNTSSEANNSTKGYSAAGTTFSNSTPTIVYMGGYNSSGVPNYLESERDIVSASILEYINASLPESLPVPDYHPSYLANGKKTTLDIVEIADVWLTFVHEGAGWRNAIGFYTYPTNTPPQSLNDVQQINVAFPNLSFSGSGGGLITGDKVNIGRFEPGTSIGLVLLADGWDGSNSEDYKHVVFADKNLNPETDDNLKQHNVLLWDEENEIFLLGFEDVRRDDIPFKCDQDFNDAILFVSSNPVKAISTTNVSPIDKPGVLDTDGDGINDALDEYPNDGTKAYDSYYPSSTTYGTFAFEDNWPNMGDFDFNDLVVDYQFKHIMNADNKVVEMAPKFVVRAAGAGYRNGFGFSIDLTASDILSTEGNVLNTETIKTNANGTEANQRKAVFIVSDNVHDLFATSGFINTREEDGYADPSIVNMTIKLNSPKAIEDLGSVPYNPFIIISQNRGREAHLPGYLPTDLVDESFFGTADDDSDPSQGDYYKSKTSLPWGINLPESFVYPEESVDIRKGHLRFNDWAKSSGYSYMDWYRSVDGYREVGKLYTKGSE